MSLQKTEKDEACGRDGSVLLQQFQNIEKYSFIFIFCYNSHSYYFTPIDGVASNIIITILLLTT